MKTDTTTVQSGNGFYQVCGVALNGRRFVAGGAMLTPDRSRAIGYPKFDREYTGAVGQLNTWDGKPMGTVRIVSMWKTPRSFMSSHMCQIEATIDGRTYTGRGCGSGMIWRGRAKAERVSATSRAQSMLARAAIANTERELADMRRS